MARIQTFNKIAAEGIALLEARGHQVGPDVHDPDGILVRSAKLHDITFGPSLRGIARAGAGVNNVPVSRCTEEGVVVFNTPGSNANSVKELVVAGLMLSSRKIIEGCQWVQSLDPAAVDVGKEVEAGKSAFGGPEIAGKRLGVIGLGAIGVMVANAGISLGMEVSGYDPYLSVNSAWGLSRSVLRATSLEALLAECDYVSIHVPLNDETRGLINTARLEKTKPGARFLNFSRDALVDDQAMVEALTKGHIAAYVTDFPTATLLGTPGVIAIPHLGASTPEAETNSAIMAAQELADFLEQGNIRNSVNFPECIMDGNGGDRIILANKNVPNMVSRITTILAEAGLNISDMLNRHRDDLAYNIIDVDETISAATVEKLQAIDGVVMARVVPGGAC
ncbi:3-phosphoglycerate dehydrogenase [Alkalispirochaeta sphaeroplastigenens]|uniref:D-3-phosphoglycerate dehydrogenase n=1 Tax=Alkalispirochaeta sphaeroplastigenens TaxID=1187066 RepID=A0A2S4JHD2_9SPIO|nr:MULTISPECIES: phosphoglycerate dehydrogenase [Alkalispirochaeta]POQ98967.1 3-phosphoglycerate dehydrogenase [Alkalispirochaeta sphaeroplastigenens]